MTEIASGNCVCRNQHAIGALGETYPQEQGLERARFEKSERPTQNAALPAKRATANERTGLPCRE